MSNEERLSVIMRDVQHVRFTNAMLADTLTRSHKRALMLHDDLTLAIAETELRNIEEKDYTYNVAIQVTKVAVLLPEMDEEKG